MTSTAPVAASDNDPVIPKIPGQRKDSPKSQLRPGPLTRAVVRDRRLTRQLDAALNTNQPGIVRRVRAELAAHWAAYDAQAV